jgi:hypothetical protein
MRRITAVVIGLCFSLGSAAASEDTYRFGRRNAIDREGSHRDFPCRNRRPRTALPETWYVDAFLPPTRRTGMVRRGTVRHLECKPTRRATCLEWHLRPRPGVYVQVADGPGFDVSVTVRRNSERPIVLKGEFSDQDLVSLVLYIRSKPVPRSASGFVMGILETDPIMSSSDGATRQCRSSYRRTVVVAKRRPFERPGLVES